MNTNKNEMIEIDLKELLQKNEIDLSKNATELFNANFWHYFSYSSLLKSIENNEVWLRNISDMNDIEEYEFHKENAKKIHSLCFCNTNSESIPMWYLYGGITGSGTSLGITPYGMKKFINKIDKVYAFNGNNRKAAKELKITKSLENEDEFILRYGWVFYKENQNDKDVISYKEDEYSVKSNEKLYKDNYFIKNNEWKYEKEFRIIIETKEEYDWIAIKIDQDKLDRIRTRIKLGPESNGNNRVSKNKEIEKVLYKNFDKNKLIKPKSSKLNIKMNLFNGNIDDILDELSYALRDKKFLEKNKEKIEKICIELKNNKRCK